MTKAKHCGDNSTQVNSKSRGEVAATKFHSHIF